MARDAAVVPSSQQDELEDDPQFAPQLQLAPPKPKRQRTKLTSSRARSTETFEALQERESALKITKPSVTSSSKVDTRPVQAAASSTSSIALERYRYKQGSPPVNKNDSNAPYKQPRKGSRDKEQKRADRDRSWKGDAASEATTSKQVGKMPRRDDIVFTMPELDEDGEPIVPPSPAQAAFLPIAEAPPHASTPKRGLSFDDKFTTTSSAASKSSIELPPGMQARLRRDSVDLPSSPRPSQASLTSNALRHHSSSNVSAQKPSSTTSKLPRTVEDEQEIAGCLEALQADDFHMFELDEEEVLDDKGSEAASDPRWQSLCFTSSAAIVEAQEEGSADKGEDEGGDKVLLSPIASADHFAFDNAAAPVPPRLNAQAFELLLAVNEPSTSSPRLQSNLTLPEVSPPLAHSQSPRLTSFAPTPRSRPPQNLCAAPATYPYPSPPRTRPTHRLVPLTTSGLVSHLETLVNSHVAEAASHKARVTLLEQSLKVRDEEIGALSAGLKQVKREREALERELEMGRKEIGQWKGKVDVLKEVRKGLLREVKESDARVAELEREREREREQWERERTRGDVGARVSAEKESIWQDTIVIPSAIEEDIEPQQQNLKRSGKIDANVK